MSHYRYKIRRFYKKIRDRLSLHSPGDTVTLLTQEIVNIEISRSVPGF
jgi:hypothetical protein